VKKDLENLGLQIPVRYNVELKPYTTFRIGGKCEIFVVPSNVNEYIQILDFCYYNNIKFRILGAGSNILIDSNGVDGVVIYTKKLDKVQVNGVNIRAECGVRLPSISNLALKNCMTGFEFCAGIPGSVGGAIVGNAGAFGGDMSKLVENVTIWQNGKMKKIKNEKNLFNYRKSVFKNDMTCAIIDVDMQGHKEKQEDILHRLKSNTDYRVATQSVGYPNAGCIFNNTDIAPAIMIEKSGLKGYRIGDAMVSNKHSNFIVNLGNAKSDDVLELIENLKDKIYRDWGKKLDTEITYWSKSNG
jgi:UDP-N-acetylmuramate dehydrogenase